MPIIGPKSDIQQSYAGGALVRYVSRSRWLWKGQKPYPALPYSLTNATTSPSVGTLGATSTRVYSGCFGAKASSALVTAQERALRSFYGRALDNSGLGAAVAEGRESFQTIADRATQLDRAWLFCRTGRYKLMAQMLGVKLLRKHRSKFRARSHQASSVWMEYWMGWAPMIGSIYDAIEVLDKPLLPSRKESGGGSASWSDSGRTTGGTSMESWEVGGKSSCKYHAILTPKNSNAALASRLGLTNPYLIAWDMVPFSFLINWFVPLDSYFSSFSFSHQHDVRNFCRTSRREAKGSEFAFLWGEPRWRNSSSVFWTGREIPALMPKPNPLDIRIPLQLSYSRAATAISLLIQHFTKPGTYSPDRR